MKCHMNYFSNKNKEEFSKICELIPLNFFVKNWLQLALRWEIYFENQEFISPSSYSLRQQVVATIMPLFSISDSQCQALITATTMVTYLSRLPPLPR